MDKSPEYLRMCEKANKTLPPHEWKDGDFYWRNGNVDVYFTNGNHSDSYRRLKFAIEAVPLYRQDQLQEMLTDNPTHYATERFHSLQEYGDAFAHCTTLSGMSHGYWDGFGSMEQLWLTFVMREKWGRVWDGRDWITR